MTIPLISKYLILISLVFIPPEYLISKNLWLSDVLGVNRGRPNKLEPKVPKELDKTKKGFLSNLVF